MDKEQTTPGANDSIAQILKSTLFAMMKDEVIVSALERGSATRVQIFHALTMLVHAPDERIEKVMVEASNYPLDSYHDVLSAPDFFHEFEPMLRVGDEVISLDIDRGAPRALVIYPDEYGAELSIQSPNGSMLYRGISPLDDPEQVPGWLGRRLHQLIGQEKTEREAQRIANKTQSAQAGRSSSFRI